MKGNEGREAEREICIHECRVEVSDSNKTIYANRTMYKHKETGYLPGRVLAG